MEYGQSSVSQGDQHAAFHVSAVTGQDGDCWSNTTLKKQPPRCFTVTYTRLSTESLSLMEWRHRFQLPTAEWTYSLSGEQRHFRARRPSWKEKIPPLFKMSAQKRFLVRCGSTAEPTSHSGLRATSWELRWCSFWLLHLRFLSLEGEMFPLWIDPCVCVERRVTPLAIRLSCLSRGSRRGGPYLSGPSAGRGWGSVKTCSVNGPGGPTSAWLGVVSGTSVASVASSADCVA